MPGKVFGVAMTPDEWRCLCKPDPSFDKSKNPRWVAECGVCGAHRPEQAEPAERLIEDLQGTLIAIRRVSEVGG